MAGALPYLPIMPIEIPRHRSAPPSGRARPRRPGRRDWRPLAPNRFARASSGTGSTIAAPPISRQMTTLAKGFRERLAEHYGCAGRRCRSALSLDRRHAQMAAALRRRPGGRNRPHPRGGSRHAMRLVPGGLHAQLRFCHTGTQCWCAISAPEEIVGQVMLARDALGEWPSPPKPRIAKSPTSC